MSSSSSSSSSSSPSPSSTAASWPFFFIAWSAPRDVDEDPIFESEVHQLIVPRHLVTPDRQALLAKQIITTAEEEQIELWLKEWKQYRVEYGVTETTIRVNSDSVCPCEDSKICPGRYSKIMYCQGCTVELCGKLGYIELKGKTPEELKALAVVCTRHPRCWCRDNNESYCDPKHRKPCGFCRYIPEPKPEKKKKKKQTKRTRTTGATSEEKKKEEEVV